MFTENKTTISKAIKSLVGGRYGDSKIIDTVSRTWYESFGAPMELYDTDVLHPGAESLLETRALNSTAVLWDSQHVFQPLKTLKGDPKSLSATDHPADHEVDVEVSSRTAEPIVPLSWEIEHKIKQSFQDLLAYGGAMGQDAIKYLKRLRLVSGKTVVGGTFTDLVGLSYFDVSTFSDSEEGSESLLHECLHSKAQRITRGFDRPFLDDQAPETLEIPWWRTNKSRVFWNTSRAFDAFHVYSHISLLAAARYTKTQSSKTLRRCQIAAFRSAYLYSILKSASDADLDEERRLMAVWIKEITLPPFGLTKEAADLIDSPLGVK